MAETVVLTLVPWDAGRNVDAYPRRSELRLDDMAPPMIASAKLATVAPDRSLTFAGLAPGEYWAIAPITVGQRDYRYIAFNAH